MTAFKIRLASCETVEINAAELTIKDSALWLLEEIQATEPRHRSALPRHRPVLILAPHQWIAAWPADQPSPFTPAAEDNTDTTEPAPRPKLLPQCTDVPDPLARHAIIAAKVALLGPQAADEM